MLGAIPEAGYVNRFMEPMLESMSTLDYRDVDQTFIFWNLMFIFFFHLVATVYVVFYAIPTESAKGVDNPAPESDEGQNGSVANASWSCIPRGIVHSDDDEMLLQRPLMAAAGLCCNTGNHRLSPHHTDSRTVIPSSE